MKNFCIKKVGIINPVYRVYVRRFLFFWIPMKFRFGQGLNFNRESKIVDFPSIEAAKEIAYGWEDYIKYRGYKIYSIVYKKSDNNYILSYTFDLTHGSSDLDGVKGKIDSIIKSRKISLEKKRDRKITKIVYKDGMSYLDL